MDRSFSLSRRGLDAEVQDAGALKRALAEASRTPALLEESLQRYSHSISTLLENDEALIHPASLDAYIRVLCPEVPSLINFDALYGAQLEYWKARYAYPEFERASIRAIDGNWYEAPSLEEMRGGFSINKLLRIKRLHEGNGTSQHPPRHPAPILYPLGLKLKQQFEDATRPRVNSFNANPGECTWDLEADLLGREQGQAVLLYNGVRKEDLIKRGKAWGFEFLDQRLEMTRAEWQEGEGYLGADQLSTRFISQGFDLPYVETFLAQHVQSADRENSEPHDTENWNRALGNALLNFQTSRVVPYVDWSPFDQRLYLHWVNPEDEWSVGGGRASVRIR